MTSKKDKVQYIANDSQRKASFNKRKKGLVKKASELATLCGIDTCAIIYSPYDAQPEVWPSPAGVQHLLSRYKKLPEMDRTRKMMNQEDFLKERWNKEYGKLKNQWEVNREKEMTNLMNQALAKKLTSLQDLTKLDLNHLGWVIDQNLKSLKRRVHDELIKGPPVVASSSMVAPPTPPNVAASVEMQQPQWLEDLMARYDNVAGFGVGPAAVDDELIKGPQGAASSSSIVVPPPSDAGSLSSSMVAPPPSETGASSSYAWAGEEPQWLKDMMVGFGDPLGDGNPSSSSSSQHFP